METSKIDQELYDFLSGTLSEEEASEVKRWIESDERNRLYFQQFKENFLKMRWGLRASLVVGNFGKLEKSIVQRHRFRIFRNLAAAVILLFGIGGGLFLTHWKGSVEQSSVAMVDSILPGKHQAILVLASGKQLKLDSLDMEVNEQEGVSIQVTSDGTLNYLFSDSVKLAQDFYHRLIIPRGGEYMMQLADGSKVWLNAATEFRYPVAFTGGQRKVFLKGEAYFEVAKDASRPFVVVADDVQVQVYGTKFNVNNYNENMHTVLLEGSVGMKTGQQEVRLKPGQKGETEGGRIQVTNVDAEAYIAWKNGDFIFNNERLEDIMEQISRWYDVDVFYNREESRNVRLSGDMKRYKDVQSLLYYFEQISEIRFAIKGRTIVVE